MQFQKKKIQFHLKQRFKLHSAINILMILKKIFYETALYLAVDNENIEIIKLLLNNDKLDPNALSVFNFNFFYKIHNKII